MKFTYRLFIVLFSMTALLFIACPTSDEPGQVLSMKITDKNDSLLTFDSLIVMVHSKDGKFSQVVFHGVLRDPKQVASMPLDARVGNDYTVTIIGYRGGQIGVNKEVTFIGTGIQSKDLPIHTDKPETVVVVPNLPEILVPSDTSIAEGDSLRFRVSILNTWTGHTTLTLKDAISGAALDTVGRNPGDGYFTWRPSFDQGRIEPYAVTFVYASANKKVEKITRVKVLNVNRPPKLVSIADQKVKENESLSFNVVAPDPDHDSLTLTASSLPNGATFTAATFTWKPSVGQAGNYSVKFRAFDGMDSDLVSVLITVGNVNVPPPLTVDISSPANDTTVNFTPITILYTVNGTPLQKKFPLKDGKNRIRIDTTVQNRAGFDTILITLDTIPPGRPVVIGASPVRSRTSTWNWSSGGNGSGFFRFRLDNEDLSSAVATTETSFILSKDQDLGTHTLFVQERDAAGNWSLSGSRAVRIDTTRPAPPQLTVTPKSPTNNTSPTWNWNGSGDDLSGLFRYKLDTNDFQSGGVETRINHFTPDKGLQEGSHALYVQQQDSAGNWSNTGSAVVFIDLTVPAKPKATVVQTSPTKNPLPTWTLSSSGGMGLFRVRLDDSNLTQTAKSGSFTSFTPDSALAHGPHMLYVQERDSAGNWSAIQYSGLMVDLIPPVAPVFDASPKSPLNSLQPTWTWKSGGGGMGTFRYKLDDSTFTQGSDTIIAALFKPAVALSEGPHSLYVQERDTAGNWSAVSPRTLVLSLRKELGGIGITPDAAYEQTLTFSKDGATPYLGFRDAANADKATVIRFNGTSWEILGRAGLTSGAAYTPSLAISNSGIPYIAYVDIANGEKITVMSFNGGNWEVVGASGFSQGRSYAPSLALNKAGVPYVAYRDLANGNKATVMRFNGGFWEKVGSAGFTSVGASFISLAFSNAGVPHVAFCNDSLGNQAVVMGFSGINWTNYGSSPVSVGSASATSLAFTSSDVPYVSFADETNQEKATVRRYVNNGWENVGVAGFTAGATFTLAFALSKDDQPFVGYADGVNGRRAMAMKFTGTVWETVGNTEGLSTGSAFSTVMAVSNLGVPHVAFLDAAHGNKATVVKTSFDP